MVLIAWKSEFETGVADVDHEHRELVDLINGLHAAIGEGAEPKRIHAFLGEVFARIAAHFALEESIMRKHSYDEYEAHKAEHEALLDELRDIMDAAEADDTEIYGERLSNAVRDWFVNHFKSKDARLHRKLGV
ncbi:MAG: hemerythrin family protein [Alphaproteobacteria bacterium]|nr:hemerythrin family protein [Alphaproteobacteria bacterium]